MAAQVHFADIIWRRIVPMAAKMDGYIQYSLMAGLGNLLAWVFVPLGFGNWESAVTSITGLVAKENVVATVGVITETDV